MIPPSTTSGQGGIRCRSVQLQQGANQGRTAWHRMSAFNHTTLCLCMLMRRATSSLIRGSFEWAQ
jgi:hypothetical protein